jgi:hypothetical protein
LPVSRMTARVAAAALTVTALLAVPGAAGDPAALAAGAGAPAAAGPVICGQPVLQSPWNYDGAATSFTSGEYPGLPTFGAPGTSFPAATAGIIVAAGDNTTAAAAGQYQLDDTVVYFEPGMHDVEGGMYAGHGADYVGGYAPGPGEATINGVDGATDGTGVGGSRLVLETASSGSNVYDTYEYLTIENYTSSTNNSVMGNINGAGTADGDSYLYDTIGPNEYGYTSGGTAPATGENSGGGYGIDGGSNTTIEYDCLTQDAQGAFNVQSAIGLHVSSNEISWNGLGEYPDSGGPGASTHCGGCSGGAKFFYTLNATVVNNYVHDNYNVGIWGDFNNDGLLFSHNYVASNWSSGFMYEASYNADVADNYFYGNGWASDGAWPAGVGGGDCYGGVTCAGGNGPVTGAGGGNPFGAVDLSDSGGNASLGTVSVPSGITVPGCASSCALPSRYSGELLVTGNVLTDNFGGVKVYTDSNRYPGNINADSACSIPIGTLYQPNSSLYYQQSEVLVTNADTTVSGSSVTSAGGATTICADYGTTGSGDDSPASAEQAPSTGMAVYNQTGGYLGNVATVTSANSFTLNDSPGNVTGASLVLSAYGGCGPADYYGASSPGALSGTPSEPYWDHCIWGSRNVLVNGNQFNMNASAVTGCATSANLCGYQYVGSFNPGIPALMTYWGTMQDYITLASGGLGDVFSGNAYAWSGPGGWTFTQGDVGNGSGNTATWAQWQGSPDDQDAGSTYS